MVLVTRMNLGLADAKTVIPRYELSEQYPSETALALPLSDPLVSRIRQLYDAGSIPVNSKSLDDVKDVTAYFCIIYDQDGNKLLALKRAAQFKAVLTRRLIRFLDDTLEAIEHSVFQQDNDFDVLVTDGTTYILRAAAFEQLADIDKEILQQSTENTAALDAAVPCVRFQR